MSSDFAWERNNMLSNPWERPKTTKHQKGTLKPRKDHRNTILNSGEKPEYGGGGGGSLNLEPLTTFYLLNFRQKRRQYGKILSIFLSPYNDVFPFAIIPITVDLKIEQH